MRAAMVSNFSSCSGCAIRPMAAALLLVPRCVTDGVARIVLLDGEGRRDVSQRDGDALGLVGSRVYLEDKLWRDSPAKGMSKPLTERRDYELMKQQIDYSGACTNDAGIFTGSAAMLAGTAAS